MLMHRKDPESTSGFNKGSGSDIALIGKDSRLNPFHSVRAEDLRPLPASVTVCATVDESGAEQVVTDLMIRRACEMMDAEQIWPSVSSRSRPVGKPTVAAHSASTYGTRSGVILRFPANR